MDSPCLSRGGKPCKGGNDPRETPAKNTRRLCASLGATPCPAVQPHLARYHVGRVSCACVFLCFSRVTHIYCHANAIMALPGSMRMATNDRSCIASVRRFWLVRDYSKL